MLVLAAVMLISAPGDDEFRSTERRGFRVKFKGAEQMQLAQRTLRVLEDIRASVFNNYRVNTNRVIDVIIYTGGQYKKGNKGPDWSGAVYDGSIHVREAAILEGRGGFRDVLLHEYMHALMAQGKNVPGWFHEGVAQFAEAKRYAIKTRIIQAAARQGKVFPFRQLVPTFSAMPRQIAQLAYSQALSIVQFLSRRRGENRLYQLVGLLARGANFDRAYRKVFGEVDDLERDWRQWMGLPPLNGR